MSRGGRGYSGRDEKATKIHGSTIGRQNIGRANGVTAPSSFKSSLLDYIINWRIFDSACAAQDPRPYLGSVLPTSSNPHLLFNSILSLPSVYPPNYYHIIS
jgi:hypothetical protein